MTHQTDPAHLATLDARRGSTEIELGDDAMSYRCVRVFGAPPSRVFRAFTDPADLRVWFPSGAPPGSEMTTCDSDPVEGGRYHYVLVLPDHGPVAWHGTYTKLDPPAHIAADEWFVMGGGEPSGPPTSQTLDFEPIGEGMTRMTMQVHLPEAEDPETFMDQSAAGLTTSLAALDEIVST